MTPDEMARIHAAAFTQTRSWGVKEFIDLLALPGSLLCTDGPAFVLGRVMLDDAEILTLACDPTAQRQGHGKAALAAFEAEASRRGAERVFLEVAEDNAAATALYEQSGYRQTGRRPVYYRTVSGQNIAALILSKALAAA